MVGGRGGKATNEKRQREKGEKGAMGHFVRLSDWVESWANVVITVIY